MLLKSLKLLSALLSVRSPPSVVPPLHNRNLLLRQPVQVVHERLNHETRERSRKARNPFAPFASFRVIRGSNALHNRDLLLRQPAQLICRISLTLGQAAALLTNAGT